MSSARAAKSDQIAPAVWFVEPDNGLLSIVVTNTDTPEGDSKPSRYAAAWRSPS